MSEMSSREGGEPAHRTRSRQGAGARGRCARGPARGSRTSMPSRQEPRCSRGGRKKCEIRDCSLGLTAPTPRPPPSGSLRNHDRLHSLAGPPARAAGGRGWTCKSEFAPQPQNRRYACIPPQQRQGPAAPAPRPDQVDTRRAFPVDSRPARPSGRKRGGGEMGSLEAGRFSSRALPGRRANPPGDRAGVPCHALSLPRPRDPALPRAAAAPREGGVAKIRRFLSVYFFFPPGTDRRP